MYKVYRCRFSCYVIATNSNYAFAGGPWAEIRVRAHNDKEAKLKVAAMVVKLNEASQKAPPFYRQIKGVARNTYTARNRYSISQILAAGDREVWAIWNRRNRLRVPSERTISKIFSTRQLHEIACMTVDH